MYIVVKAHLWTAHYGPIKKGQNIATAINAINVPINAHLQNAKTASMAKIAKNGPKF